jgi:putative ABC transport system substrate-binding protein
MNRNAGHSHAGLRRRVGADDTCRTTRRKFLIALGAGALAAPGIARAQRPAQSYRIGVLQAGTRVDAVKLSEEPFLRGLAELGYAEGRNLVIDRRYAEGRLDRLPALAKELVALKPDLILAPASQPAATVKAVTTTIPIVFCFVTDPVAFGFAQSLARPGGNLTGLSNFSAVIAGKRIELLREIAPKLMRLCAWYNPDTVNDAIELSEVKRATAQFGMQFIALKARNPAEYDEATTATRKWGADAIYINSNPTSYAYRKQIIGFVAGLKMPAVYWNIDFAEDGGLIAYAPNFHDLARRAAVYADKILRGAKPAELPIEQPTKVELAVNIKTAKALGVKIPQSILVRANKVIE